jgi:cell division protein FtsB
MQLVTELSLYPARCAVTARDDLQAERFIDTEASLKNQRVYLSESAIKPAAVLLGYVDPAVHGVVVDAYESLTAEVEDLEAEAKRLRDELDAVHILRRRAYSAEQKRGPKEKS